MSTPFLATEEKVKKKSVISLPTRPRPEKFIQRERATLCSASFIHSLLINVLHRRTMKKRKKSLGKGEEKGKGGAHVSCDDVPTSFIFVQSSCPLGKEGPKGKRLAPSSLLAPRIEGEGRIIEKGGGARLRFHRRSRKGKKTTGGGRSNCCVPPV